MAKRIPVEVRFWAKVYKEGPIPEARPALGRCWVWQGKPGSHTYGVIGLGGRELPQVLVHRWAYEYLVGPIPPGLTIDHLCRNHMCVNPKHLEPVTRGENVLRGVGFAAVNAAKSECPNGHIYDDANTAWYRGYRNCRQCGRDKANANYRRKRAALGG